MKLRLLALLAAAALPLRADTPLAAAVGLYRHKQYAAAQAALQAIVSAEPRNAAACYYLGLALRHRGGDRALDDALPWLEKAVALDPGNAAYLGSYGGACFQLADKHHSYLMATRGRDAMEGAVQLDPGDLDSRSGLMQFYARAPWPLGSSAKARTQAVEIARRNPQRGIQAWILLGRTWAKQGDIAGARAAYRAALALDPASRAAAAGLAALP